MTAASLATLATYLVCGAAYAALTGLILLQARRSRTGLWLAAAAAATAAWAGAAALIAAPGVAGTIDLVRLLAWYGFCLHLYRRAVDGAAPLFAAIGAAAALCVAVTALLGHPNLAAPGFGKVVTLASPAILLRLVLGIGQLLLLENIYRGCAPEQRWHVGLACCTLGALAAYDVVVCADAVLLHQASPALLAGRPAMAILAAPLLAVAAARNRHWRVDIHVSRTAAFHSATLVVSGVFLIALAAVGEFARHFGPLLGVGWGGLAEVYLLCAGILTVLAMLTSGSARSAVRRVLVDHFFTHRYDYRQEWQRCIARLSAAGPLRERAIRALAGVVDSPAGLLFLREPGQAGLAWAAAWNTPPCAPLNATDAGMLNAGAPRELALGELAPGELAPGERRFEPWLAVPLHEPASLPVSPKAGVSEAGSSGAPAALGCILLGRPRVPFRLDAEVFDLLRILAHEVSVHLAQERAAASLLQARALRDYGERFAFVAHDVKNVASQLSLLLSNAETHLADPAFQKDMLATVRASVARIGGLIRRLEPAAAEADPGATAPLDVAAELAALLTARRRGSAADVPLEVAADGHAMVVMAAASLRSAVTHLLDNAEAAAGPAGSVRVTLRTPPGMVAVDIADTGPGMTPEFIRDELFRPFATRTEGGSGLGAFQARTLLRAAGGELAVMSTPGRGTTMRLTLPRVTLPQPEGAPTRIPDLAAAEA